MALARRYLIAAVVGLLGGSASAGWGQYEPASATIEVRFVVFGEGVFSGIKFTSAPGQEPVELRFLSTQRSRVFEYRGPNPIIFFSDMKLPPEPARPGAPRVDRITVARALVGRGAREALLLFVVEPGWEKQPVPRYLVEAFDDSRAAVPLDHVAFLNATGLPLFGTLGSVSIDVPNGLSRPMRVAAGETQVTLNVNQAGSVLRVYGDLLALERNQRLTVVLFPPPSSESVYVRRRLLYDPDHLPNLPHASEGPGG